MMQRRNAEHFGGPSANTLIAGMRYIFEKWSYPNGFAA
jgi:hypothetical protein